MGKELHESRLLTSSGYGRVFTQFPSHKFTHRSRIRNTIMIGKVIINTKLVFCEVTSNVPNLSSAKQSLLVDWNHNSVGRDL